MVKHLVRIGALALAAALMPAQEAEAQVGFGAQASYDFIADGAFGVGARANVGISGIPIGLQGTVDYFFGGDDIGSLGDYWKVGANGIYQFMPMDVGVSPYVGGGLDYVNFDGGSDTGWQLLGGTEFGLMGAVTPFAEIRWVNHDDADLLISVGVNF